MSSSIGDLVAEGIDVLHGCFSRMTNVEQYHKVPIPHFKSIFGSDGFNIKPITASAGGALWLAAIVSSIILPLIITLVFAAAGTVLLYNGMTRRNETMGIAASAASEAVHSVKAGVNSIENSIENGVSSLRRKVFG